MLTISERAEGEARLDSQHREQVVSHDPLEGHHLPDPRDRPEQCRDPPISRVRQEDGWMDGGML